MKKRKKYRKNYTLGKKVSLDLELWLWVQKDRVK